MEPAPGGYAADARPLFAGTESDLLVVTDGGFVMERTDAPRVLLYANSDLSVETGILSLPRPRHPRNILRLWRFKRPFRRMIAAARNKKVVIVPGSHDSGRLYEGRCAICANGPRGNGNGNAGQGVPAFLAHNRPAHFLAVPPLKGGNRGSAEQRRPGRSQGTRDGGAERECGLP